jgi:hypothetical protein
MQFCGKHTMAAPPAAAPALPPHPRPSPDRAAALQRLAASNDRPTWQRYLPGVALFTAVTFLGAGACGEVGRAHV